MSFTTHRHLNSEKIRRCLPKRYHAQFRSRDFTDGDFVLVVFSSKETILSSHVRKALEKLIDLDEPNRIAAGYNFTREAFEFLSAQGFRSFFLNDFAWTDDKLKYITQKY